MAGYQEMLTDPSFAGQIVAPTYPLIGNYGINDDDHESVKIQVRGFVVREHCTMPSHYCSRRTLDEYLAVAGIPGISGIDTRALTRRIRLAGVMMGILTSELTIKQAKAELAGRPGYGQLDYVKQVSTPRPYAWDGGAIGTGPLVAVLDCGVKFNILRILRRKGCRVTVLPVTSTMEDILRTQPGGVIFSPGPGDPALLAYTRETIKGLIDKKPVMGICLGHQLIAHTLGGKTFKLKFGHRGGNHPVYDRQADRVYITTQNHGYAVDPDSLPSGLEVSQVNLNDNTVEGLSHRSLPLLSIQYHPEAAPGPEDNTYLFERFIRLIEEAK
jgi:carbamoyl-phosphate synthase small subunit